METIDSSKPPLATADPTALAAAFTALRDYDSGSARAVLVPIDAAVRSVLEDKPRRAELERRLVEALAIGCSPVAARYVCAQLALIGSAGSVQGLGALLADEQRSDAARLALEAIPGSESAWALRDHLPRLDPRCRIGAIRSIGARRDAESVPLLAKVLDDSDPEISSAAIAALGAIGHSEAARILRTRKPSAPASKKTEMADALLVCAEHLLATGRKGEALAIYNELAGPDEASQVQLAAKRGLFLVAQTK
jgi:hypothetical protein